MRSVTLRISELCPSHFIHGQIFQMEISSLPLYSICIHIFQVDTTATAVKHTDLKTDLRSVKMMKPSKDNSMPPFLLLVAAITIYL